MEHSSSLVRPRIRHVGWLASQRISGICQRVELVRRTAKSVSIRRRGNGSARASYGCNVNCCGIGNPHSAQSRKTKIHYSSFICFRNGSVRSIDTNWDIELAGVSEGHLRQLNIEVFGATMILDRNSQVGFHKTMKTKGTRKINRAPSRALPGAY